MTSWRDTYRVEWIIGLVRHQDPAWWEAFSRRSLPTLDPRSTSIRLPIDPLDNSVALGLDYNARWTLLFSRWRVHEKKKKEKKKEEISRSRLEVNGRVYRDNRTLLLIDEEKDATRDRLCVLKLFPPSIYTSCCIFIGYSERKRKSLLTTKWYKAFISRIKIPVCKYSLEYLHYFLSQDVCIFIYIYFGKS